MVKNPISLSTLSLVWAAGCGTCTSSVAELPEIEITSCVQPLERGNPGWIRCEYEEISCQDALIAIPGFSYYIRGATPDFGPSETISILRCDPSEPTGCRLLELDGGGFLSLHPIKAGKSKGIMVLQGYQPVDGKFEVSIGVATSVQVPQNVGSAKKLVLASNRVNVQGMVVK